MTIPDFITHYNRSEPFRSLSSLPTDHLATILPTLNESNTWGLSRFGDPEYLNRRSIVEKILRAEFIKKGGRPLLDHPIYFFLGHNPDFERHESNKPYRIHLRNLPATAISFTYGDSMFSFIEEYRSMKGEGYRSKLCPQLYRLEDLPTIFTHPDFQSPNRLHIEAQLWITPPPGSERTDT